MFFRFVNFLLDSFFSNENNLLIRNWMGISSMAFRQLRCLSVLDFWNVNLGVYYKIEKKNRFRNKLDFLSSSNLIFTACVACKNQFRNQIDFLILNLIFRYWKKIEWHSIFQKSSGDRQGVDLTSCGIIIFFHTARIAINTHVC